MPRGRPKKTELVRIRREFPPEFLEWVLNPETEITEEADKAINRVLLDRKKRSEVFLTALARKHIQRLVFLFERLPTIEEELFKDERIKVAQTSDLIRLLSVVGSQIQNASEFLQMFVTDEELKSPHASPQPSKEGKEGVPPLTDDEKKAVKELPVESRQRLRRIVQKLMMAVDESEKAPVVSDVKVEEGEKK